MLGSKFTESSCLVKKNNGKQVEDGLYLSRIEGGIRFERECPL